MLGDCCPSIASHVGLLSGIDPSTILQEPARSLTRTDVVWTRRTAVAVTTDDHSSLGSRCLMATLCGLPDAIANSGKIREPGRLGKLLYWSPED